MAQTYLQLINKVLVALREDAVAGVTEPYSLLIGQFVNEAKEQLEDEIPWRALRTEVAFATTASTTTTTLTSTNDRSYLLDFPFPQVFRTDSGYKQRIQVIPIQDLLTFRRRDNTGTTQEPNYVAFTSDGTNLIAHFYPTPDATYNYVATIVVPQAELTEKTDTLTIAYRPVVLLATFYAMDERGSEFAGRLETVLAKAERAKVDAILREVGQDNLTVEPE